MKLNPEKLLWLLVLLPAIPFIVHPFLQSSTFRETAAVETENLGWLQQTQLDFAPAANPRYQEECGSCHFAFQPGLLPERSWQKIMSDLENHFGDSAELGAELQQTILEYLVAHSADKSDYLRSQHLNASIESADSPIRITDTLYFKRKHHGIPDQLVKANLATGSFSNCNNCHRHAAQGYYNEQDVLIPSTNLTASTMQ